MMATTRGVDYETSVVFAVVVVVVVVRTQLIILSN